MKAMILLGINCGMGNNDVAELQESHFNLDTGIIEYARPKTGIERRAVLWPETMNALQAALAKRPRRREARLHHQVQKPLVIGHQ